MDQGRLISKLVIKVMRAMFFQNDLKKQFLMIPSTPAKKNLETQGPAPGNHEANYDITNHIVARKPTSPG